MRGEESHAQPTLVPSSVPSTSTEDCKELKGPGQCHEARALRYTDAEAQPRSMLSGLPDQASGRAGRGDGADRLCFQTASFTGTLT